MNAAQDHAGIAFICAMPMELLPLVRLTDVLGVPSDRHDGHVAGTDGVRVGRDGFGPESSGSRKTRSLGRLSEELGAV